jgi:UPF0176 protein
MTKAKKSNFKIILFYQFFTVRSPEKFKRDQMKLCTSLNLKGRILVAKEGINATLEGAPRNINKYMATLKKNKFFKDLVFKESAGNGNAFPKMEVKVRDEAVTLGISDFNVKKETAKNITATELHNLYKTNEDFTILDLRNNYEIEVGQFEKTEHPNLQNFRELPQKLSAIKHLKNKKIIAVCTGGIRCEKATCFLKQKGFKNLYQLKDGIHTYMQKYPAKHFKGSLFVFDNRMVTPVKDSKDREVIGKCYYCQKPSEDFYNNDIVRPSIKIICCSKCIKNHKKELRQCVVN